jgi:acetyl-CoA carboxylase biotin carboxyl carrier protein
MSGGMPIDVDQIIARMQWAAARGLTDYAQETAAGRLSLVRGAAAPVIGPTAPAPVPSAPDTATPQIVAPLAGLCQLSPEPGAAPFVLPGMEVAAGQTLCLIEAMKVMTAVTAEAAGVIEAVLVNDGSLVEAGTPLFRWRA